MNSGTIRLSFRNRPNDWRRDVAGREPTVTDELSVADLNRNYINGQRRMNGFMMNYG